MPVDFHKGNMLVTKEGSVRFIDWGSLNRGSDIDVTVRLSHATGFATDSGQALAADPRAAEHLNNVRAFLNGYFKELTSPKYNVIPDKQGGTKLPINPDALLL
jgi:hypothetical protein